ncbi:MAG: hypothetical protein RPU13_13450 [Candidatus Sedimenticola sp. (ex Thyasira tokunagai)]
MTHPFDSDPIFKAELTAVVYVSFEKGTGEDDDPVRTVMQYWSPDGRFLAENEPNHDGHPSGDPVNVMSRYTKKERICMTVAKVCRPLWRPFGWIDSWLTFWYLKPIMEDVFGESWNGGQNQPPKFPWQKG